MIEIKFPADRPDIALALGNALTAIGAQTQLLNSPAPSEVPAEGPKPAESPAEEPTQSPPAAEQTPTGSAPIAEPPSADPSTTDARVDQRGVAFNPDYCGEAEEPFYTTGKMLGQWKKRRGVDQADYDAWYASELGATAPEPEPAPIAASAAFGAPAPVAEQMPAPSDAGELMVWVSEKQAAGLLTQQDVNSAWSAAGVIRPTDLFGPNAGEAVAAVYRHLAAMVRA